MKSCSDLELIAERLQSLSIDDSKVIGQEIDQEKVNWYLERFKRAMDDGCPEAVTAYLQKLNRDSANEITRVVIMHNALNL